MVCPWRVELLEPRGCQLIPSSLLLHPQSLPSSQLLPAPSAGLSLILLPSCSIPSPIPDPGSFLRGLNLNSGCDEGVKPALNPFPTAWEAWGVLEGFEGCCQDLAVWEGGMRCGFHIKAIPRLCPQPEFRNQLQLPVDTSATSVPFHGQSRGTSLAGPIPNSLSCPC